MHAFITDIIRQEIIFLISFLTLCIIILMINFILKKNYIFSSFNTQKLFGHTHKILKVISYNIIKKRKKKEIKCIKHLSM